MGSCLGDCDFGRDSRMVWNALSIMLVSIFIWDIYLQVSCAHFRQASTGAASIIYIGHENVRGIGGWVIG